jgi:probable O-glycosylation ligase (exosortase A-associated)
MWEWALKLNIGWSFYVAMAAILGFFFWRQEDTPTSQNNSGGAVMLAFGVWITLSALFAINPTVSYQPYIEYLKIFVMFFLSMRVIRKFSQLQVLYIIAAAVLGYIAYEINSLYLFDGRVDIYNRGYGGLDNNGAGLMLAMGVPLAFFLWQGQTQWWRWPFLVMLPSLLHAVLMSYSRGAMLSLLLTTPLIVIRSRNKKMMIVVLTGLFMLVPVLAGQEIRNRFFTIDNYQTDESANSRFDSWKAAINIAKDYPVFGAGVRNSNLLSHRYGADIEGRTIHSLYLQIAADSGFPALGLYLAMLYIAWSSLRQFQKQYKDAQSSKMQQAYNLACGLEISLVIFSVGAIFLSLETFELPYLLLLLAFKLPITISGEEV